MALSTGPVGDVLIISVHDEEEPVHFSIPNVVPSRYEIPGINAPKEQFDRCRFSFPDQKKPFVYAVRRTLNHRPYVMIRICEPKHMILGTEKQSADEYGQRLSPDVQRVPVPIRTELLANEIENQCGRMGMEAIRGEVTEEVLDRIEAKSIAFMRATVVDTNRLAKRSPLNITPQARRRAWRLHKMGLLNPLPEWAEINPNALDGASMEMFNCIGCQKQLRKSAPWCDQCGAVYDWKKAVELGKVKPSDVPPTKRAEAGLEASTEFAGEPPAGIDEPEDGPETSEPNDDRIEGAESIS